MIKDYTKYLNYTETDFLSARQVILDALTDNLPEYSQEENDMGTFLVDVIAMWVEMQSTYYNIIHNELNPNSMQLMSSILNYLDWYDYPYLFPTGAMTYIFIQVDTAGGNVTLPAGTKFTGKNLGQEVIFELVDDYTFFAGEDRYKQSNIDIPIAENDMSFSVLDPTFYNVDDYILIEEINGAIEAKKIIKIEDSRIYVDLPFNFDFANNSLVCKLIPVYQGETIENLTLGISSGEPYQIMPLRYGQVHVTSDNKKIITVHVDGEEYEVVDSFVRSDIVDTTPVCKLSINRYGEQFLQFGGYGFGKIPPTNAEIIIDYLSCNGAIGNIPKGSLKTSNNSLIINIYNPYDATGGTDGFTLEEVKNDFTAWRKNKKVGYNVDSIVHIARGMQEITNAFATIKGKVVTLIVIPEQGILTDEVRTKIYKYFGQDKLIGGYVLTVEEAVEEAVNIEIVVKIESDADTNQIRLIFNNKISELFLIENAKFGDSLYASQIHNIINEDEEIKQALLYYKMVGFDVASITMDSDKEEVKADPDKILGLGTLNLTFETIT